MSDVKLRSDGFPCVICRLSILFMYYYFAREKETDRNEIDLNLDLSDNQSELLND